MLNKNILLYLLLFIAFISGCQTNYPIVKPDNKDFKNLRHVQEINNLMIIIDASASMSSYHKNKSKISIAKNTLRHFNQYIPLKNINVAIRTIGKSLWPLSMKTELVYELKKYSRIDFDNAIKKIIWTGGKSPLSHCIEAATMDLSSARGTIALVIISDGEDMDRAPVMAAENMKNRFKNQLCIYTIHVGKSNDGKKIMADIANAGGCGISVNADRLSSRTRMKNFISKIFYSRILDIDNDGVSDDKDKCLNTPEGFAVDENGCYEDLKTESMGGRPEFVWDEFPGIGAAKNDSQTNYQKDNYSNFNYEVTNSSLKKPSKNNFISTSENTFIDTSENTFIDTSENTFIDTSDEAVFNSPKNTYNKVVINNKNDIPQENTFFETSNEQFINNSNEQSHNINFQNKNISPYDKDSDGVNDNEDKCPDTPYGARVDVNGCFSVGNIYYASGQYSINPGYYPELFELILVLKRNNHLFIEIEGHTDNNGSIRQNRILSARRANYILNYFRKKGISPHRLSATAYGSSKPIASNDTFEGQAKNRRVEIKIIK